MAFDSLSEKLQNVFKNLRSKGRLTEDDVKTALKEVKMALLEADVNFRVVKKFVKDVQERAIGQDVMSGLNPGQMVIKIVLFIGGFRFLFIALNFYVNDILHQNNANEKKISRSFKSRFFNTIPLACYELSRLERYLHFFWV